MKITDIQKFQQFVSRDQNVSSTKGRAVFLASIMVLSVVAVSVSFTGAAAATITDTSTNGPAQATAGDTIELSLDVAADSPEIRAIVIDPAEQADHVNEFDRITIIDPGAATDVANRGAIIYREAQTAVTASWELTVPETAEVGDTVTITGDALGVDGQRTEFSYTVEVVDDGGDDDPPGYDLPGGAVPTGPVFEEYPNLKGLTVWQGQKITIADGLQDGVIQLRERIDTENTRLVSEYRVSEGSLIFDTEDLSPGNYYLTTGDLARNDNGIPMRGETFELEEQSLTAAFGTDTVRLEGPNSADDEFTFESNRLEYPINVTTASGDLAAEDLADIFVGGSSFTLLASNVNQEDDTIVLAPVQDADEYVVDFGQADIAPGEYEFVFSGTDTTAAATDTITVDTANGDEPRLFNLSVDAPSEAVAGSDVTISVDAQAADSQISAFQINPEEQPDHVNDFDDLSVTTTAGTQIEDPGFVVYSELQNQVTVEWTGTIPDTAEAGETYTLTGDALDEPQNRQLFSHTVTVTDDPLAKYRNDNGEVDDTGLLEAISDWRNNELDDTQLLQLISEWRDAGDNVETLRSGSLPNLK